MIKKRAFVIFGRASVEIGAGGGGNMKKEGKQNKAQAEKIPPTSPGEQNASSDLQPGQGQYFVSGGQW